jgi:hypothetical protein
VPRFPARSLSAADGDRPGDDQWFQPGPGGVDGGGVAGGAGPDDDQLFSGSGVGAHEESPGARYGLLGDGREGRDQALDAGPNLVADGADGLHAMPGGVLQDPVLVAAPRKARNLGLLLPGSRCSGADGRTPGYPMTAPKQSAVTIHPRRDDDWPAVQRIYLKEAPPATPPSKSEAAD